MPGGHSPGYFAVLNNPLADHAVDAATRSGVVQQLPRVLHRARDRASVVGTGGRLEELSRAVAERRLRAVLRRALREGTARRGGVPRRAAPVRRWAMDQSDQGAVYLGYRLGHIKGDSRVFRAMVYNKGAAVLHMLRRLVGDDAFFRGLRRYYARTRSRRPAPKICSARWKPKPDDRSSGSSSAGSTGRACRACATAPPSKARKWSCASSRSARSYDVPVTVTLQLRRQDRRRSRRAHRSGGREALPAGGNAAQRRDQRRLRGARDIRKKIVEPCDRTSADGACPKASRSPTPASARRARGARTPRRTSLPSTM